jgi:hypothetical protein
MKTMFVVLSLLVFHSTEAQPFRNLDFEEGNRNYEFFAPGEHGSISDLLPGWTISVNDTFPVEAIHHNAISLSSAPQISLFNAAIGGTISGQYSLSIFYWDNYLYTLRQTGEIPADAQLLTYDYLSIPLTVKINGVEIAPITPLRVNPPPVGKAVYDVSAFSGQIVDLSFTTHAVRDIRNDVILDNIAFVIPEPRSVMLGFCGVGLFSLWLLCSRHRTRWKT